MAMKAAASTPALADPEHSVVSSARNSVKKTMAEAATTVANEVCGEEEIDGVMHKTVEADYEIPAYQTKHHQKYWFNPETGWISKAVTETSQSGFESVSTQLIEKAPDLELPTPE